MKIRLLKALEGGLIALLILAPVSAVVVMAHLILLTEFEFDLLAPPQCHQNEAGIRKFTRQDLEYRMGSSFLFYPNEHMLDDEQRKIDAARTWVRTEVDDVCLRYGYNYSLRFRQWSLNDDRHELKERRELQRQFDAVVAGN